MIVGSLSENQSFEKRVSIVPEIVKKYNSLKSALENALRDGLKEKVEINILFSPACSSFDEFKNFEERGKFFKKYLKSILKDG